MADVTLSLMYRLGLCMPESETLYLTYVPIPFPYSYSCYLILPNLRIYSRLMPGHHEAGPGRVRYSYHWLVRNMLDKISKCLETPPRGDLTWKAKNVRDAVGIGQVVEMSKEFIVGYVPLAMWRRIRV